MNDPKIEVWFTDEVHFQHTTTVTRMWALKGMQPQLPSKPGREKIGYYGAVNPKTGQLFVRPAYTFNSNTCASFLDEFMMTRKTEAPGVKIVMVADNASWHKRPMRTLAERLPAGFAVLYLPPYSPDLNVIERVWRLTRRVCTHNKYFDHLDEMAATLIGFFMAHAAPNDTLRKLCAII